MGTKTIFFILLISIFVQNGHSENLSLLINQNISTEQFIFNITTQNQSFNDTFYFSFETNTNNYTIEYWVENNLSQIVKVPLNTTNCNQKQFTPKDDSQNYTVHAILYSGNISTFDNLTFSRSKPSLPIIHENPDNPDSQIITNTTNTTNICNYTFKTNLNDNISTSKIYFKFKTNAKNYTIKYWIEDFIGNTVKEPIETTNTNQKQFTPKPLTNIFYINSQLKTANCTLNSSQIAFFYSPETYESQNAESDSKSTQGTSQSTTQENSESKIDIVNIGDIISGKTKELIYEIYRGETAKRTTYFYLNDKKIGSAEIPKYTKLKGRMLLSPKNGINNLTITGLDIAEQFVFSTDKEEQKTTKKTDENKKSESKFEILNFSTSESQTSFSLNFPEYEIITECYITYIKTKVSEILNISEFDNKTPFNLIINNSKLQKKEIISQYPLKLTCRHKKPENTYYSYDSIPFNYTINKQIKVKNSSEITSHYKEITLTEPIKPQINTHQEPTVVLSDGYKTKQNSYFFVFLGSTLILFALILRW